MRKLPAKSERTSIGDQFVIDGYQPATTQERLEQMARLPIGPKRASRQKRCDIGLFDEVSRAQMDLL